MLSTVLDKCLQKKCTHQNHQFMQAPLGDPVRVLDEILANSLTTGILKSKRKWKR